MVPYHAQPSMEGHFVGKGALTVWLQKCFFNIGNTMLIFRDIKQDKSQTLFTNSVTD